VRSSAFFCVWICLALATVQADGEFESPPIFEPRINVRDYGAVGDGKANDTIAFQKACAALNEAGTGTLIIPFGTYILGGQRHIKGKYPYFQYEQMIDLRKVQNVAILGNGATLRVADGLRYGTFDKDTGEPFEPESMPFTDYNYQARVGSLINVQHSSNIWIQDLELDGNLSNLILGGRWGDTGRQVAAIGLRLYNNRDVHVRNIHTHHHALDGVIIGWQGLKATDPSTPHHLVDVTSEYNGRQGLSWVGGRGVTAKRCKFNHTGRAGIASSPGAGLDIEAEHSVCRDGLFIDCEFNNNVGCGIVADSGDGGYSRFENCTIWGSTNWSVWAAKPGLSFDRCRIYGSIVHGRGHENPKLATRYTRCHFEDRDYPGRGCYRSTALVMHQGDNVLFEHCTIIANRTKACYVDGAGSRELFRDCVIEHRWASPTNHDFLSIFRGTRLERVTIRERLEDAADRVYYVAGQQVEIGSDVTVQGPRCKMWNWSWGKVGVIKQPE